MAAINKFFYSTILFLLMILVAGTVHILANVLSVFVYTWESIIVETSAL